MTESLERILGVVPTESWFRSLLDAAPDAMVIVDPRGEILWVNRQTEELFGFSREELLAQPVEVLVPRRMAAAHIQHRQNYFKNPSTRPMGANLELLGRRKDDSEFPVEISLSPLKTNKGIFVISVIRDVTAQKQAQKELERYRDHLEKLVARRTEELRKAERLATVGELAARIAHEIKNPLTGIYTAFQLLQRGIAKDDLKMKIYEDIGSEIRRLDETVKDLLAFARPNSPNRIQMELKSFLSELIVSLRRHSDVARHQIHLKIQDNIILTVDPRLIGQVFANLILNASQAMEEPGEITVEAHEHKDFVLIDVRDTGPGVAEGIAASLFEPFFTTKSRGTGLGLSICRKNIEAHGGTLEWINPPGKGSVFRIKLSCRFDLES